MANDDFFKSGVPLDGGGDTHPHPFGRNPEDFTITTSIPIGGGLGNLKIHDNPFSDLPGRNDIGYEPPQE
jgi:hypothetical protein